MDLYEKTNKEIIEYKKFLTGYFSDFDYDSLKLETNVDFEDSHTIEENIINTIQEYEELQLMIMVIYMVLVKPKH